MKRRSLLKLAGTGVGAALLTPFLARVASAGPATAPRFVFFVEGNGFEASNVLSPSAMDAIESASGPIGPRRFFPDAYRHDGVLETSGDLEMASALTGLPASLRDKTAVLLGLSSEVTGGGHSALHGVLSSRRSASGRPTGETIDAYLARALGSRGGVFDAVRVGFCSHHHFPGKNLDYGTCADGPGRALPLVLQPQAAFDMLFGSATTPDRFMRDERILEFAEADADRVVTALGAGAPDVVRLQRYLDSLRANLARRAALSSAVAAIPALPGRPGGRTAEDIYPVLNAQASNLAVALQGGLTHVGVLGIATGADFDTFYDTGHRARHTTHHELQHGTTTADFIDLQSRRQIQVMIDLAATLDAVPEGSGTLLDHTVLVYVGDNGETHHASGREFPVVLIGGSAVGLRTGGRTLVYPGLDQMGRGHRQISNLWNTLGHVAGQSLDDFGAESGAGRSAFGPLPELVG